MATVMLIIFRIVIALIGIAAVYLLVNWLFGRKKKERKENPLANRIGTASEELKEKDKIATEAEDALRDFNKEKNKNPAARIEKVERKFEGDGEKAEEKED